MIFSKKISSVLSFIFLLFGEKLTKIIFYTLILFSFLLASKFMVRSLFGANVTDDVFYVDGRRFVSSKPIVIVKNVKRNCLETIIYDEDGNSKTLYFNSSAYLLEHTNLKD